MFIIVIDDGGYDIPETWGPFHSEAEAREWIVWHIADPDFAEAIELIDPNR